MDGVILRQHNRSSMRPVLEESALLPEQGVQESLIIGSEATP